MKLVSSDDRILKTPCEKFNFMNPQCNIIELVNQLITVMNDNYGIGIAAPQIGIPLQVFVLRGEEPVVVINPKILESAEELVDLEEGCLSFPNQLVSIKRPIWIKVRYNSINGQANSFRFEGITARAFQHEFDHLNGKTMYDHLSKLKRDIALKKMKKVKNEKRN